MQGFEGQDGFAQGAARWGQGRLEGAALFLGVFVEQAALVFVHMLQVARMNAWALKKTLRSFVELVAAQVPRTEYFVSCWHAPFSVEQYKFGLDRTQ